MTHDRPNARARLHLRAAIVALAATFSPGAARAADAVSLTSADLVARLKKSPHVELLFARIDRARAEVARAGTLANPTITFQREDVAKSPENILMVELPVEISGRRSKNVEAREAAVLAAEADVARELELIELAALAIYYRAAAAKLRVEVLQAHRESVAARVAELRARATAGEASGFDLGRLELELAQYDDLAAGEHAVLRAHQRALAIVAGEPNLMFAPSEVLARTATTAGSRGARAQKRLDHRAAQARVAGAELALTAAKRGWIPSLVLSGGVKTAENAAEAKVGYVAAVGIAVPIFDRGLADRDRAAAELNEARAELRLLEIEIAAETAQAREILSMRLAQSARWELEILPKLDVLVRRAEATYREGEHPVFELLDAYRTARDHRLRHVELLLEVKLAELEVRRAQGGAK